MQRRGDPGGGILGNCKGKGESRLGVFQKQQGCPPGRSQVNKGKSDTETAKQIWGWSEWLVRKGAAGQKEDLKIVSSKRHGRVLSRDLT